MRVIDLVVTSALVFAGPACGVVAQDLVADPSALPPLASFKDCDACPGMVVMPPGTFIMGGPPGESRLNIHWDDGNIRPVTADDPYIATQEGPLHAVTIDLPIAMGRNEVTVGEWNACVADGGCGGYVPPPSILVARGDFTVEAGVAVYLDLSAAHPVVNVSYDDAQLYLHGSMPRLAQRFTACRPKRNGNMPHARAPRRRLHKA